MICLDNNEHTENNLVDYLCNKYNLKRKNEENKMAICEICGQEECECQASYLL